MGVRFAQTGKVQPSDRAAITGFACAAAVAFLYVLLVGHIWEDYFITFRHSENLCNGDGLVYNVGDTLHGFTSPLGTLLPAVCHLVTGRTSYEPTLWLFRIFSILAFAGGAAMVMRSFGIATPYYRLSGVFVLLLYIFDAKAVEFSTDGQESAFMLLCLASGIYVLMRGAAERWLWMGLVWAGLMWTRPDGCVYVVALAFAGLIFGEGSRKDYLVSLVKSAAVCTILYLPWFLWAWSYYGSPVPQTIIAKAHLHDGLAWQLKTWLGEGIQKVPMVAAEAFQPIYDVDPIWWAGQDWSQWFLISSTKYLGLFCALYWLFPVNDRLGRLASFCFVFSCLYLSTLTTRFPWYTPPITMFASIVLARGVFTLCATASRWFPGDTIYGNATRLAVVAMIILCIRQAIMFSLVGWQMRIQQDVIEMGHRREVGEWLKKVMQPDDHVMLEPFGYIGYFSGAKVMDWPGLVSREVTRARKEQKAWFEGVASELQPEWLVLRPREIASMASLPFFKDYALVRIFDATPELSEYSSAPGPGWLRFDAVFCVFRKLSTHEKSTLKEVSIPVSTLVSQHMRWDGNIGEDAGSAASLAYSLSAPERVAGIRVRFAYEDTPSPVTFRVSWASPKPGIGSNEESYSCALETDRGELTILFWIDGVIDRFQIQPDKKPFRIKISEVTLLMR